MHVEAELERVWRCLAAVSWMYARVDMQGVKHDGFYCEEPTSLHKFLASMSSDAADSRASISGAFIRSGPVGPTPDRIRT